MGISNETFIIISDFKDKYINICILKSKYYWKMEWKLPYDFPHYCNHTTNGPYSKT